MTNVLRSLPRGPLAVVAVAGLMLVIDDWLPDLPYLDTDFWAMVLCFAIGAAALHPVFQWRFDRTRLTRTTARAAAALAAATISLSVALVVAEYTTRWVYRDVTTTADDRGYFTRRWQRTEPAPPNTFGYREREFAAVKPPHIYRIAVVGDSFTYGNGLPVDSRFSNLMQHSLPSDFEVLNFGTPGHNTPQHVDTLRKVVMQIHPDFVLVQWFVNDVEGTNPVGRPVYRPLLPFRDLDHQLYNTSAFYTLASMWWTRWQANWTGRSYDVFLKTQYGDPQSPGARLDRDAMNALVQVCRDHDTPLGIVLFPDSGYDLGRNYPLDWLHRRVTDFCADEGLTCLDLRPDFAAVPDRSKLWVNSLDHHPSARANVLAATRILETYEGAWMAGHHAS